MYTFKNTFSYNLWLVLAMALKEPNIFFQGYIGIYQI